jgi:hypothetical protein
MFGDAAQGESAPPPEGLPRDPHRFTRPWILQAFRAMVADTSAAKKRGANSHGPASRRLQRETAT